MTDRSAATRIRFGREGRPIVRAIAYDGGSDAVAGIVARNALMSLVTLGFYRFWGKTRLRRYLWSHVVVDGERLEYTGRPVELFLGFLVAVAVLIGLALIGMAIELAVDAETPSGSAILTVSGIAQAALILFLFQFAIYRARRYRLTRTQWRGIRGAQSGSAVAYGLRALAWLVASILSLGLLYPAMRLDLQRTKIRNTWIGSHVLEFDGRARHLFGPWLLALLLALPTLGLSLVWYRAREFRYWTQAVRLAGLRFASDLPAGKVMGIVLAYLVATTVLMVIALAVFGFGLGDVYRALNAGALAAAPTGGAAIVVYGASVAILMLLLLVVAPVLNVLLLVVPLGRAALSSVGVSGELDLAAVRQSTLSAPRRGEGFADALDIGSI